MLSCVSRARGYGAPGDLAAKSIRASVARGELAGLKEHAKKRLGPGEEEEEEDEEKVKL